LDEVFWLLHSQGVLVLSFKLKTYLN
jgi:hypothetical protein